MNFVCYGDLRAIGNVLMDKFFMFKKDISKGFPGERALDEGYIVKDQIPRKFYPARAVVDPQTLRGKVALAPMAAGLPVLDGSFVDPRPAREAFAQRLRQGGAGVALLLAVVHG